MKLQTKLMSAILMSTFAASGFALTSDQVKTEQKSIEAQYKTDIAQCKTMNGNAKDVCEKEAKGKEKVAKAELKAKEDPTEFTQYKARLAHADAAYDVAKERCDDQSGNAKDVCVKDAKAAYVKAKEDAKVKRTEDSVAGKSPAKQAAAVTEAKKDAAQETREAQYKAAKERCDAMSGANKDACVNEAKTRFGQ